MKSFSLSLCDLMKLGLENNSDIKTAEIDYKKSIISSKNSDGVYAPKLSFSSSMAVSNDFRWETTPDNFISEIVYSNLLPGGTSISLETGYGFNSMTVLEERFLNQRPYVIFSVSQSLLPFWAQGKKHDPIKFSSKQKNEYYYYQYVYIKRKVMLDIFRNYILVLISEKEIEMYQNTLDLCEEQIKSLQSLNETGNTSQIKILEAENTKWNALQNLMIARTKYLQQIQNIKILCGKDFDENTIESPEDENLENELLEIIMLKSDPLEQMYRLKQDILKTERILEKQNCAPSLSFSIQPNWNLKSTKVDDWKSAWKDVDDPSLNFSVGLNLSPLIAGIAKQNKENYQLDYANVEKEYQSYLTQKEFVKEQYEGLLEYYSEHYKTILKLYELGCQGFQDYQSQYNAMMVSKLDFETVKVRVENYRLSKECIELYINMYKMLLEYE